MSLSRTFGLQSSTSDDVPRLLFWHHALSNPSQHSVTETWIAKKRPVLSELPWKIVASHVSETQSIFFGTKAAGSLLLRWSVGEIDLQILADTPEGALELRDSVRKTCPAAEVWTGQVSVKFWFNSPTGCVSRWRLLDAPSWDEIESNYPSSVRSHLSPLISPLWRPIGGRLILWQGSPGTGKTYALRALIREWKSWCQVSYITDPEEFFGSAAYMMSALLPSEDSDKWQLVVLEDAGELVAKDARPRTGQALSRLLNVADGMIGQGLKVIVLITTNEEVDALHEAASRPGRCASRVKFTAFESREARQWFSRFPDASGLGHGGMTLAEMYAALEGRLTEQPPRRLGFGS